MQLGEMQPAPEVTPEQRLALCRNEETKKRLRREEPEIGGVSADRFEDFKRRMVLEAADVQTVLGLGERLQAWCEEFWPDYKNTRLMTSVDENVHRKFHAAKEDFFSQLKSAKAATDLTSLRRTVQHLQSALDVRARRNKELRAACNAAAASAKMTHGGGADDGVGYDEILAIIAEAVSGKDTDTNDSTKSAAKKAAAAASQSSRRQDTSSGTGSGGQPRKQSGGTAGNT